MTRPRNRHQPTAAPRVRCAVYTRKSTEEGLDQEFNTLDAQRESGEAYIKSQTHEGWECLPDHYDDGGFTGGNMDRPALKRLMADIESGRVDCVVVYKVDRLSRSLLDFAKMMEVFEKYRVSFVSVTQQFVEADDDARSLLTEARHASEAEYASAEARGDAVGTTVWGPTARGANMAGTERTNRPLVGTSRTSLDG